MHFSNMSYDSLLQNELEISLKGLKLCLHFDGLSVLLFPVLVSALRNLSVSLQTQAHRHSFIL